MPQSAGDLSVPFRRKACDSESKTLLTRKCTIIENLLSEIY